MLLHLAIVAVLIILYSSTNNIHPVQAEDDDEDEQGMSINRTEDGYSEDAMEDSLFRVLENAMDTKAVIKATEVVSDDQKLCKIFLYVKSRKCISRVHRLLVNDEFAPFQKYMYNFNLNFTALMIKIHDRYFKIARTPEECEDIEDLIPMNELLAQMRSFMNDRAMKEVFLEEIETNQFYVKLFRDINYGKAFRQLAKIKLSPEYTLLMQEFYENQFTFRAFAEAFIFPDMDAPLRRPVDTACEPPT